VWSVLRRKNDGRIAAERAVTRHLKNSVQKRLSHADGCLKREAVMYVSHEETGGSGRS
jgi:hypothetical protein